MATVVYNYQGQNLGKIDDAPYLPFVGSPVSMSVNNGQLTRMFNGVITKVDETNPDVIIAHVL
jgi:hypothetical protein